MMKCTICKKEAHFRIPRHNVKFCKLHFDEYVLNQVKRAIKHFNMFNKNERIGVAVSGGKDSIACIDILNRLGYDTVGIHINLGIVDFSEKSEKIVLKFSKSKNIPIYTYLMRELFGLSIIEIGKPFSQKICSVCGKLKRYYLSKIAKEIGVDVIVTGHNLDDVSATLLGNLLFSNVQYLARQYPVIPAENNNPKKAKPLVRLTDQETKLYLELRGIEYVRDTCPLSKGANSLYYKEALNNLESHFKSIKAHFYFSYLDKIQPLLENKLESSFGKSSCKICGEKTSSKTSICFVCSIKSKLLKNRG
ncbi:MAG: adenine nucleotide alpha hydrolase family protein [Candidatus Marinimicrobia bacterium]|nr:adenine nucleotide alpha hydrolase family protein [Candidatus Neomarinimicrobiota bacterium]